MPVAKIDFLSYYCTSYREDSNIVHTHAYKNLRTYLINVVYTSVTRKKYIYIYKVQSVKSMIKFRILYSLMRWMNYLKAMHSNLTKYIASWIGIILDRGRGILFFFFRDVHPRYAEEFVTKRNFHGVIYIPQG